MYNNLILSLGTYLKYANKIHLHRHQLLHTYTDLDLNLYFPNVPYEYLHFYLLSSLTVENSMRIIYCILINY